MSKSSEVCSVFGNLIPSESNYSTWTVNIPAPKLQHIVFQLNPRSIRFQMRDCVSARYRSVISWILGPESQTSVWSRQPFESSQKNILKFATSCVWISLLPRQDQDWIFQDLVTFWYGCLESLVPTRTSKIFGPKSQKTKLQIKPQNYYNRVWPTNEIPVQFCHLWEFHQFW